QRGSLSEINVTPFVDVMLVLLVIFMVTAPMMEQGLDVNLPEVEDAPAVSRSEEAVTLTVLPNGTVAIGQTTLKRLDKIGPVLKQMLSEREEGN
ncbi:MAG: protein TolR, partial [Desulfuromonadales bacterium]|nr:protein TolR [Desulfuromonadales bacterium]NIS44257.1 protein TolR [Desulfuromonadales bacterium]